MSQPGAAQPPLGQPVAGAAQPPLGLPAPGQPPTAFPGAAVPPTNVPQTNVPPVPQPGSQTNLSSVAQPGSQTNLAPVAQPGYPGAAPTGQQPGLPPTHTGPQPGLPITQFGPQTGLPIPPIGAQIAQPITLTSQQAGPSVADGPGATAGQYVPGHPPGLAPARPPMAVKTLVSVVLLVLAAGLAIGGSFATLDVFRSHGTDPSLNDVNTTTANAWSLVYTPASDTGDRVQYLGYALSVGALLALAAAVLLVLTGPRLATFARAAAPVAAGLLFGVTLTVAMSVLTDLGFNIHDPDFVETVSPGLGFWLVLGGCALAIAAIVITLMLPRTDQPSAPNPQVSPPPQAPQYAYGNAPRPFPGAGPPYQ
jgi:hypothetical protein